MEYQTGAYKNKASNLTKANEVQQAYLYATELPVFARFLGWLNWTAEDFNNAN